METYTVKTRKGYDFYEVASAFQKAVRRGEEEDAMYWGIELYESGYMKYAWKRMVIMASEDVGLGEPSCIVQIMALKQSFDYLVSLREKSKPERLPFTHALICLVRSRKSRYIDHAITVNWQNAAETYREFKDYVYDCHTRKGKSMGRGLKYFYEESCKITNANKLKGEEELEREAWKIDNVRGIEREDEPTHDEGFNYKKKEEGPTLF